MTCISFGLCQGVRKMSKNPLNISRKKVVIWSEHQPRLEQRKARKYERTGGHRWAGKQFLGVRQGEEGGTRGRVGWRQQGSVSKWGHVVQGGVVKRGFILLVLQQLLSILAGCFLISLKENIFQVQCHEIFIQNPLCWATF